MPRRKSTAIILLLLSLMILLLINFLAKGEVFRGNPYVVLPLILLIPLLCFALWISLEMAVR
ncbi:hypothetical protein DRN86_05800 [Candidatus Geothermarchaeota archaeon]|nr:MAG: hypothetical protein DRN86_05800 [Candidatus Geothermarchaeota archaeon]